MLCTIIKKLIEITPEDIDVNYNLGVSLMALGQLETAADFFSKTIQMLPQHVEAHINLAAVLHKQKRYDDSIYYYQQALSLKPGDPLCEYMLAAMGVTTPVQMDTARQEAADSTQDTARTPVTKFDRAPKAYVSNLFDRYALDYDRHLIKSLNYCIPDKLATLLTGHIQGQQAEWDILDIGCGTGLVAESLQSFKGERLVGIDLSPKMINMAQKRQLYSHLLCVDICDATALSSLKAFDLIVAADVFSYIGDLNIIFSHCSKLAKVEALFMFSVEKLADTANTFKLQSSGRFAHSMDYIKALSAEYQFECLQHRNIVGRRNNNQDVPFELFLLQKIT